MLMYNTIQNKQTETLLKWVENMVEFVATCNYNDPIPIYLHFKLSLKSENFFFIIFFLIEVF